MKRKLFFLSTVLLMFTFSLHAEVLNPVKWTYSVEKAGNSVYNLKLKAFIDPGWHLYSQHLPEGGPIPTSFQFTPSENYDLAGKTNEESKPEVLFDKNFSIELRLFSKEAVFVQKIKVKTATSFNIKGSITFMSCNDHQCLPPRDEEFSFMIPEAPTGTPEGTKKRAAHIDSAPVQIASQQNTPLQIIPGNTNKTDQKVVSKANIAITTATLVETTSSLWQFFLLAFAAGLLGMLTPCVYPMIPMTLSFFMRGEEKKSSTVIKALLFGCSIVFIYTAIGVIVAATRSGANVTSVISSHWIPNLLFFLLFLVFAASFFGMFEIVLPGSLTNSIDRQADKGGYLAVFFMALTLVVVSFSCTGPIVGALLVEASKGMLIKPVLGMFGFSLAFAIPFVIFAISPAMMKKLAKSGSWLNSVKIIMAFILLAFSLKFLLAIDTTHHLNILTRNVYLSVWIVIFSLLGFYLAGKVKFAHDGEVSFISVPRLVLIIATFSFVLYMVPGLFGAPLSALASVLPPPEKSMNPTNQNFSSTISINLCEPPRYGDFLELPFGLKGYFDYEQGLACAKRLNLPVFLDIKGHTCSNCKVMEATVFSDPGVLDMLSKNFVMVALYTDDQYALPEKEWTKSAYDGKTKKTMGAKNLDLEISKFISNTQPLYAILKADGTTLVTRPFDTDVNGFIAFLTEGRNKFKQ